MPGAIEAKSILNKTKKRGTWFLDDYTINPFSGCSFNCLYCYIRGSKYGEHMEEKVSIKTNALEVLEKQLYLRAKKGEYGVIVISSATDPYLHFEKELGMTREILELVLKYRFPVHIITKSDLVIRDFDLLREIHNQAILPADLASVLAHKAFITFSFSTIDDTTGRIFEPGATLPSVRLNTLKSAVANGFHSGVSMMPLLPYISDTGEHLHKMFSAFREAGTRYIFPASITLFGHGHADSRTLVFRAIAKHYPHLMEKYERLLGDSDQMPAYYTKAFNEKAKELCAFYGIPNSII